MHSPEPNKRHLSRQLESQLRFVLNTWIQAHGPEETKRMILPTLARLFRDKGAPFTSELAAKPAATAMVAKDPELVRLQAENKRLRSELTGPTSLVAKVDRQTFALGVPLAIDDRNALQSLSTSGSVKTAEALGRLLVARAEQEAQAEHEPEAVTNLDPGTQAQTDQATRTRRAQDLLFQASPYSAPKGRAQ